MEFSQNLVFFPSFRKSPLKDLHGEKQKFGIFPSNSLKDFKEYILFRKIYVIKHLVEYRGLSQAVSCVFTSFAQNPFKDVLNKK